MTKGGLVINVFEVTYLGYNNIKQIINLITHADFIKEYKPLSNEKDCVKEELEWLQKRKHKTDEQKEKIKELKTILNDLNIRIKRLFGGDNIFTTESPLFKSLENNGVMVLPKTQGGETKVKLEII